LPFLLIFLCVSPTSFHTHTQTEDIISLEGREIALEVSHGRELPVTISQIRAFSNDNYVAVINFFYIDAVDMRQMLNNMNSGLDELEVTIKPTRNFRAERYFNAPANRWLINGSIDAFDRAKQLCERVLESIFL
jgi:hypothetical protein